MKSIQIFRKLVFESAKELVGVGNTTESRSSRNEEKPAQVDETKNKVRMKISSRRRFFCGSRVIRSGCGRLEATSSGSPMSEQGQLLADSTDPSRASRAYPTFLQRANTMLIGRRSVSREGA
jgi:hypothetical protein